MFINSQTGNCVSIGMLSIKKTFAAELSEDLLKELTLQLLDKDEFKQADVLFESKHCLGPVKRSRKGPLQVIEYHGQTLAFLD